MTSPTCVSSRLDLRLVVAAGASLPVSATLRYDVDDPYAVTVAFNTSDSRSDDTEVVEWTFARALLADGVSASAGQGDVRAWPAVASGEAVVCLSLSSPSGTALFELPTRALVEFLTRTFVSVPTGAESDHLDLDAELALLLWAAPET
ncbi:MAG: SsgA family sporulation/cell division regulator [Mycobacteriales bacterium]